MSDDSKLLHRYCQERSEKAFAELVQRHLRMVYFAALRQVAGNTHRAQDVSQVVFTKLALKAPQLANRQSVAGWLYNCARYVASRLERDERRRLTREVKAQAMIEANTDPAVALDWNKLAPVIDEALLGLNERDREIVLLHYYQGNTFVQISAMLGLSADAARFRLERAHKKIRASLARHGVQSTSAALALAFAGQAQAAIPPGLSTTIAGAAFAAQLPTTSIFLLSQIFMSTTKLKLSILVATALVIGGLMYHDIRQCTRIRSLEQQLEAAKIEGSDSRKHAAALRSVDGGRNTGSNPKPNETSGEPNKSVKNSPAFQNLRAIQARTLLDRRYGALFKTLALTPAQLNQFKNLLIEKQQSARDALVAATSNGMFGVSADSATVTGIHPQANPIGLALANAVGPIDQQIQSLLGDSGFGELQQYEQTLPERSSVTLLGQSLSYTSTPLTDEQANQMIQMLAQYAPGGNRHDVSSDGPLVSNQSAEITDQEILQAQTILSQQQMEALKQIQQEQQVEKQMQQLLQGSMPAVGDSNGG